MGESERDRAAAVTFQNKIQTRMVEEVFKSFK